MDITHKKIMAHASGHIPSRDPAFIIILLVILIVILPYLQNVNISTTTVSMAIKLNKMVIYLQVVPAIKVT